jgi:predicted aspartyl protease
MAETTEMGRVTTPATIENLDDLYRSERGEIPADQVRSIVVADALVDTGATMLALPSRMIRSLGLKKYRDRVARTPTGIASFACYGTVKLTIGDRDCRVDVSELADDCPVIIGQIPLESMDWVVDPGNQRLIGNPEHGGKWMMDMF